jgi:pimeloyl-ACP methyl ester carboxylesterase
MTTMQVNGAELFYEERGVGEPVLFAHGLLFSSAMFRPLVDTLCLSYRCVVYDHRGHGLSDVPASPVVEVDQLYADTVALLEGLRLGPCHFVGFSLGGFIGLRLAARRPDLVRSLCLVNSSAEAEAQEVLPRYRLLTWALRWLGAAVVTPALMEVFFGSSFRQDPTTAETQLEWERRLAGNRRSAAKVVRGVLKRPSVVAELSSIHVPTLIVAGNEDVATPPEQSFVMHRAIAGSRLVVLPGVGHTSPVEQPQVVAGQVERFLSQVRLAGTLSPAPSVAVPARSDHLRRGVARR